MHLLIFNDYKTRHDCPSVRQPANGRIFTKSFISVFCGKSVENVLVSLKYDMNNGTVPEDKYTFIIISR